MPMPNPWGEIEVLDAHTHLFSRSFFAALAGQKGVEDVEAMVRSLGWEVPPESNAGMASLWVRELDRHGVSKCVLIASVPGDEESVAVALASHPDRFFGYFMLDPLAEFALARARRAFDELGLQGLCLFPAMHRFSVQDERLQPLYDLAAERPGRVVFVHSGVLTVGVRARLGLPSRFDMSRSNPIDLHRVALEHPATNFVVPHFGAGYLRETLMLASLASNVHVDTSSSNGWTKYLTPRPSLAGRAGPVPGRDRAGEAAVRVRLLVLPAGLAQGHLRLPVRGAALAGLPGGRRIRHPGREPLPAARALKPASVPGRDARPAPVRDARQRKRPPGSPGGLDDRAFRGGRVHRPLGPAARTSTAAPAGSGAGWCSGS